MKNRTKTVFTVIMGLIFAVFVFLPSGLSTSLAETANNTPNTRILNGDYANDSVIVTLTDEETMKFKTYTPNDFGEVGCLEVEDLTADVVDYVKNERLGIANDKTMLVNTDKFNRILKLKIEASDKENIADVLNLLDKRNEILYAEPNYIGKLEAIVNDTYYSQGELWGLNGTYGIKANEAWDISIGSSRIKVGVLDSGIDGNHPDLKNNLDRSNIHRDFTVDPARELSYTELTDPTGHGTHVAGIIGASCGNSVGVSGVCWNVDLVSLRISGANGEFNFDNFTQAINYAASKNISILNYSGGWISYKLQSVEQAIENYAGLFVCSVGNGGTQDENGNKLGYDTDKTMHYPSIYSYGYSFSNRVIAVGAIDKNGEKPLFSNFGQNTVSIYAPGKDIISTYPLDLCSNNCNHKGHNAYGYHNNDGTSMATPYVTGVAALILSKFPNLRPEQIKQAIVNGSDRITFWVLTILQKQHTTKPLKN